ncbi:unnamed protein product [Zymoseptoria tritici ST99CH_3D1]|nr:unnamed protein product [Zymoseptoria tritici ST99CH_3D1]
MQFNRLFLTVLAGLLYAAQVHADTVDYGDHGHCDDTVACNNSPREICHCGANAEHQGVCSQSGSLCSWHV